MRLHRLTLTAFGPFGGTQHIDFDALSAGGLFLLHGPTGAGKTAILDGVCYALYGSVPGARQQAPGGLRSDHADPGTPTEVVLELTIGGRRLEVTRRPERERPKKRGTGFTLERAYSALRERAPGGDGGWRALSRSHQEIGEELAGLLGMNREQFCQVVLLPQGDFARFLRAGAEDRAKLLGRLFDTRRFAAVEQQLAERRQAATAGVREGDDRLRSLADRLRQAAGAGEPEEDLLSWAAQLRTLARERRDIAAQSLRTAEAAHARAEREVTATADRVRRAERRAEARARAAVWEAEREERERTERELADARAAESVTPALRLRDRAAEEHRDAVVAARLARAELPAAFAGASAATLAEEERTVRGRLGALSAARQAEERASRLAAECAALERADAEDTALLAGTVAALERFAPERDRLAARLRAAEAAGARAGHRAEAVAETGRRLAAARRRQDLDDRIEEAAKEALRAREHASAAYEDWLDLKERRLRGMAAELAAALREGEPCAVCGSTAHPRPAPAGPHAVSPDEERAAEEKHRAASDDRDRALAALAGLREAHAAADAAAGAEPAQVLADRLAALERDQRADLAAAEDAGPAGEELAAAERRHAGQQAAREDIERRVAARAGQARSLRAEHEGLRAEIRAARGEAESVAARAADLAELAGRLASAAEAVRAAETSAAREREAEEAVADAARRAGFATPEAASAAQRSADRRREAERRLEHWRTEAAAIDALLAEAEVGAAEGGDRERTGRVGGRTAPSGDGTSAGGRDPGRPLPSGGASGRGRAPGSAEPDPRAGLSGAVPGARRELPGGGGADGATGTDLDAEADADAAMGTHSATATATATHPATGTHPATDTPPPPDSAHRPEDGPWPWPGDRGGASAPSSASSWPSSAPSSASSPAAARWPGLAASVSGAADAAPGRAALDAARRALERAVVRLREAASVDSAARARCRELDALSAALAAEAAALGPVREEAERIARLAGLAAGTAAENRYRMRLETYVLAARLEQVAEAAGSRLHRMSAGRYQLAHSDSKTARGRSGLGLQVLDAWTGRARDTATLSGGESFFVSLALALGLADVVAAEAGGQRLDTLFIDEGFGSLDEQSLDEVLDVLDGLREQDRAVGIVSHVPDLRARIPTQLRVIKTARGSTVQKTG
ncbi:AAA family ATPase [Streptomyces sp. AA0539]|uniref:AAA family ATPase n=1 Tax=Streptomyces sp. AA0539 TaxID=1210045 RepID=UPI00030593A8|nr:AAA family ATPase [Streptomyces sp. AA0539]